MPPPSMAFEPSEAIAMRLRNPGGLEKAVQGVRTVQDELQTASISHGSDARKNSFLSWCNHWATPQLGNHFPASEGIFGSISLTALAHFRW